MFVFSLLESCAGQRQGVQSRNKTLRFHVNLAEEIVEHLLEYGISVQEFLLKLCRILPVPLPIFPSGRKKKKKKNTQKIIALSPFAASLNPHTGLDLILLNFSSISPSRPLFFHSIFFFFFLLFPGRTSCHKVPANPYVAEQCGEMKNEAIIFPD